MDYKLYKQNPQNFFYEIVNNILSELENIKKEYGLKSQQLLIYKAKKIINKTVDELYTDIYMKNKNNTSNYIQIDISGKSMFHEILNKNEINLIDKYLMDGLLLNMINFMNIIYYLEFVFRFLYLRVGITNAKHEGNHIFKYSELSQLVRKKEFIGSLDIFLSSIVSPTGYNIRNKIIHGEYNDKKAFVKYGLILLLLSIVIFNLKGEVDEEKKEIEFRYRPT